MDLEPKIWGPHYWFVLHTIALCYPLNPNSITKKKYYELIHNIPIFLPHRNIGIYFNNILNKYPITPYLDTRETFMKWVHFIHNQINKDLGLQEISFINAIDKYYNKYKPKEILLKEKNKVKEKYIYLLIIIISISFNIYIYNE